MNKKVIILIVGFILILGGGYFINRKYLSNPSNINVSLSSSPSIQVSNSPLFTPTFTITPKPSATSTAIPTSYTIDNFPFASQAPFANWDKLHDEACEEASVILVKWWQDGKSTISNQTMDEQILAMVDWQNKNWGGQNNLTMAQTSDMANQFYHLKLTPKYDITIDTIKKEVSQNHPVIIPAAGRLLGNPNYRAPGPIYHMLVVVGYNSKNIITMDVGTRNGNHYTYNQEIFYNAIHDWAGNEGNIQTGQKAMLVLQ